ncbi:MAG: hypothetical protein AB7I30_01850 [Isosphaeraceae bacterium]
MRGFRRQARLGMVAACLLAVATGCHNGSRRVARAEPGLSPPLEPGISMVEPVPAPMAPTVTWVDRHPLFSKPRDIYESTNSNGLVKAAAATLVGVPVGFVGEIKQIVVGAPPTRGY